MSRARSGKLVLDASAGTKRGDDITCAYDSAVLYIGYRIEASVAFAATTTTLRFLGSADPVSDDLTAASTVPDISSIVENVGGLPAGVAFATGVLTLTAVGAAATPSRGLLRIVNPPPIVIPVFTYGSAGGTYRIRLKAWV